nr:DUF1024 family protein [Staphylococcus aureus]
MNNREKIEQSVISASAYNGNDTEGLLKEIEDVYKKTVTIDVDENLLVVASNEISELLYEYDSELMSADEDGDNRDIEEKRDALKQAIQIIDKLTWGV